MYMLQPLRPSSCVYFQRFIFDVMQLVRRRTHSVNTSGASCSFLCRLEILPCPKELQSIMVTVRFRSTTSSASARTQKSHYLHYKRSMTQTYAGFHWKCLSFFPPILTELKAGRQIFSKKNLQYKISWKSIQLEPLLLADGGADTSQLRLSRHNCFPKAHKRP